ncbi:hypothetical protein HPB49_011248 [Dermacentor silvarum]|uniref:Uncharacterized protein n=1 Tax=Dermacentor silvarum TaxID=543639 RepID=A0ACB8DCG5_DERSI|nr:hypothetical protein HPB49_011248 [Dermacentor silvarum]
MRNNAEWKRAPAYKLPENEYTVEAIFGNSSREAAEEAVLVGFILRIAASELGQDDAQNGETDEYSFHSFWAKLGNAVKKASDTAVVFLYNLGKEVKYSVKEVVKAAANAALETAKEKASEKAVVIVTKILDDIMANTESLDYKSNAEFVNHLGRILDQVGQWFVEEGSEMLRQ